MKKYITFLILFCWVGVAAGGWDEGGWDTSKVPYILENSAPSVTDDDYSVPFLWVDVTNDKNYILIDATPGAAVWQEILYLGGSISGDLIPTTDNTYDLGSSSKRWAEGHVTLFLADNASVGALDVTGVTDNNIFYMSASGAADSPLDRVDATTLSVTGADPAFTLIPETATDTRFWFGNNNNANGADDDLFQIGTGTTPGTNPKITMDKDGNVGINTTTPTSQLHIVNTYDATIGNGAFVSLYGVAYKSRLYSSAQNGVLDLRNSSNTHTVSVNSGASSYFNGGNVGIGTTSPLARADIKASTADGSTDGLVVRDSGDVEVFAVDSDGKTDTVDIVVSKLIATTPNTTTASPATYADDASITVTNAIMRVAGDGGAKTLDTDPAISDGTYDGQRLILQGCHDTNTLTIADACNTQLNGGASVTLGLGDILQLVWDAGQSVWWQAAPVSNN